MPSEQAATTLRGRGFDRLWARCRDSLERSGHDLGRSIQMSGLDDTERKAIAGLIGRLPGSGVRLRLADIDRRLIDSVGVGLPAWLERSGDPLANRPAERASRVNDHLELRLIVEEHRLWSLPWTPLWLDGLERDGLLARMAGGASANLRSALEVLSLLPVEGEPLAIVSARATGDTKALTQTRIAGLVERALCEWSSKPMPTSSFDRRKLWEHFGVEVDEVSSTVLLLNVDASPDTPLGTMLGLSRASGEPMVLTLRQLLSRPLTVTSGRIFICENPAVVSAAAGRLGTNSAPIICTEGVPGDAFWQLAAAATAAGATLRVHADFDPSGLNIAGSVIERCGAKPWRFTSDAYLAAVRDRHDLGLPSINGEVPASPWDPALATSLASVGSVVYEELVIEELLADLDDTS